MGAEPLGHSSCINKSPYFSKGEISICLIPWLNVINVFQMKEYRFKYPISLPQASGPVQPRPFMTLASRYGLKNMEIAPSTDEQGPKSVEEEFASYTTSMSHRGADVVAFWEVRRSRNDKYAANTLPAETCHISHHFSDGNGLFAHSSVISPMQACILFKWRD